MNQPNLIKRIGELIVAIFFLSISLGAVTPGTIGFKIGYTHNQLRAKETGANVEVTKMATNGKAFGLVGNIKINSWLYFQPEFLYFEKGGKYDVKVQLPVYIPGFNVNVIDSRVLEYIEIPLLIKILWPVRWPVVPTFLTGLSFGLKLRGQLENNVNINISGYKIPYYRTEDISSQLNTFDISYVIGGGLDFKLGRSKISLDQRFSFGLNPNEYRNVIPASYFQMIGIPVPQNILYNLKMYNYVFHAAITFYF